MTEHHDHRDDCPFKFATLDVCDCVEKNMLDRIEALLYQRADLTAALTAANARIKALEAKLTLMMTERDEAWKRAAYAEKMWGEAEVKLAKAEAGLLAIAKRDEQMIWGEDYEVEEAFKDMRDIALATLAAVSETHKITSGC